MLVGDGVWRGRNLGIASWCRCAAVWKSWTVSVTFLTVAGRKNAVPPTVVYPCITNVFFSEDFKVGQNVAQYWNDVAPEVQWRRVIRSWYDEVGDWSSEDTPKFRYTRSSPGRSCRPTQTHTHLNLCMIL